MPVRSTGATTPGPCRDQAKASSGKLPALPGPSPPGPRTPASAGKGLRSPAQGKRCALAMRPELARSGPDPGLSLTPSRPRGSRAKPRHRPQALRLGSFLGTETSALLLLVTLRHLIHPTRSAPSQESCSHSSNPPLMGRELVCVPSPPPRSLRAQSPATGHAGPCHRRAVPTESHSPSPNPSVLRKLSGQSLCTGRPARPSVDAFLPGRGAGLGATGNPSFWQRDCCRDRKRKASQREPMVCNPRGLPGSPPTCHQNQQALSLLPTLTAPRPSTEFSRPKTISTPAETLAMIPFHLVTCTKPLGCRVTDPGLHPD